MISAPHARPVPTGRPAVDSATVEKGNRLACWLWSNGHHDVDPIPFGYRGTDEVRRRFAAIFDYVERVCAREGRLCDAELIPRLRGLEGRQVVLAFDDGRHVCCLIGQQRSVRWSCMSPSKTKMTTANRSPSAVFGWFKSLTSRMLR